MLTWTFISRTFIPLENRKFLDQNRIQGLCCFVPTLRILTSTPIKRTPFIPFSLKEGLWLTLIQDQLVAEMLVTVPTGLLFIAQWASWETCRAGDIA